MRAKQIAARAPSDTAPSCHLLAIHVVSLMVVQRCTFGTVLRHQSLLHSCGQAVSCEPALGTRMQHTRMHIAKRLPSHGVARSTQQAVNGTGIIGVSYRCFVHRPDAVTPLKMIYNSALLTARNIAQAQFSTPTWLREMENVCLQGIFCFLRPPRVCNVVT